MTGIENGWVCDVELAKKIILAHFDTSEYYCCSVYGDFSIIREKGWFLGGPDGWSGFVICTLDTWLKEMNDCDPNEEVLSVCEVDGKPIVFVLHESD